MFRNNISYRVIEQNCKFYPQYQSEFFFIKYWKNFIKDDVFREEVQFYNLEDALMSIKKFEDKKRTNGTIYPYVSKNG